MLDLFLNREEAEKIKETLQKKPLAQLSLQLQAQKALADKLYTVTEYDSPVASGNKHDYCSEGPYFWPNPADPNGPYLHKDGQHNPNRFLHHYQDLNAMNRNAYLLSAGAYYLDEPKFAQRALQVLDTWFVNEETKMNPNMQFAQGVRGRQEGSQFGMIESRVFITTVMSCWYLAQLGYEEQLAGIKAWFKELLYWMHTSELGLLEKNYKNNHATWYNTQCATYAALCGDKPLLEHLFAHYQYILVPRQMNPDGSFIDELTRTNSFSYSRMVLDAAALLCEIAWHNGQDLYHFTDKDGKGFARGVEFLAPYSENTFTWKRSQIGGFVNGADIAFQLAGVRLENEACKKLNDALAENTVMVFSDVFGIFDLMIGNKLNSYLGE